MNSAHSDEIVLVTGATDGLGRALALDLAASGATVLCHGRDEKRGQDVIAEIIERSGNRRLRWYRADLSSLREVRRLADEVMAAEPTLTAVVSNAGIGPRQPGAGARLLSVDGHELRFAVNYLSGYLLVRRLLPLLSATARRLRRPTRVVSVASSGQAPLDFDNVMLGRHYDGFQAYCQSKLAQVMMTFDRAEDFDRSQVAFTVLHPSTYMNTKMVLKPQSTIADGVNAVRRALLCRSAAEVNGRYYDVTEPSHAHPQAYDADARRRLRVLSDKLCELDPRRQGTGM